MEKNGKTKNIVLAVLLVAVVTLSIAYAVLSATLTINAQATVKGANWDVEFQKKGDGAVCVASSKSGAASTTASVTQDASITATSMDGLEAILRLPGDKVVCTWQVINKGGIDAKLATYNAPALTITGTGSTKSADEATVTSNITTSLTVGGQTPAANRPLPATTGNVEDVVLTIQYKEAAEALPTGDVTVKAASTTFIYEQN